MSDRATRWPQPSPARGTRPRLSGFGAIVFWLDILVALLMLAAMLLPGYRIYDVKSHCIPAGREISAGEFIAISYMAIAVYLAPAAVLSAMAALALRQGFEARWVIQICASGWVLCPLLLAMWDALGHG